MPGRCLWGPRTAGGMALSIQLKFCFSASFCRAIIIKVVFCPQPAVPALRHVLSRKEYPMERETLVMQYRELDRDIALFYRKFSGNRRIHRHTGNRSKAVCF